MNSSLRAFIFGALAGVAVAVGPSCGPVKAPCGPSSCSGCCQTDGTCIPESKSSEDSTCGRAGVACADCRTNGNTCVNAVCSGGSDGGAGSCGTGTCAGCCTGTSSTSVCFDPPTRNNCGANGALCQSCAAGQACEGGGCVSYGDAGVLGRGCGNDTDCASLGATHQCKTKTASQRDVYYDGYCTRDCALNSDCGANGVCVEPDPGFGELGRFCLLRCDTAADCRSPGYDCYATGSGAKGCWISPLPTFDAGPPADKVGEPCTQDLQCQAPPRDGACLPPTLLDGGPSPYVGGYCTAPCDDSSHCSTDGGAGCFLVGAGGAQLALCLKLCDAPNQGPSNCRIGYLCRGVRQGDGGMAPKGVCTPSCLNIGALCPNGTICQANGYCQ